MSLQQEIAELCKAILSFEKNIEALREELFNLPVVTKQLIWNHIVGASFDRANGGQIVAFFSKHGLKLAQGDIQLLLWHYSSNKDQALSIDDLWQIFKPLSIKFLDQIMKIRDKKISIAKFHEAHYKVSDLLAAIMKKTLMFLNSSQKMKENIVKAEPEGVVLDIVDAPHLQIYLNQKTPIMLLKQVQVVFQHIIRNQIVCLKNFQEYFIPIGYKSGPLNPNYKRQAEQVDELKGIQLMKYHAQNVHYVMRQRLKRPLYLQTATSLNI